MPFDGNGRLDRARLAALAKALRQPMPPNFYWAFDMDLVTIKDFVEIRGRNGEACNLPEGACGSAGCALGLACVLWPDFHSAWKDTFRTDEAAMVDMPDKDFWKIFYRPYPGCDWKVPPEVVADRIEHFLKENPDAV